MNGWAPSDNTKLPGLAPIAGVVTNQVISKELPLTAGGSCRLVVKVGVSGVTQVGTLTLKLQSGLGSDWVDSKSTTFTADGKVYIKLLAEASADQTHLPLLNRARMVLTTTNGGDAVTIDSVEFLQEL